MVQNAENPVTQMPKAAVKGPSGYIADVTTANELKVSISGSVVIPVQTVSEGLTGAAVPADATFVGGVGTDGLLHGLSTDNSGQLNVNVVSGGGGGTVTANQGTAAALVGAWPVEITDGTNILGTSSHPVRIDPTGTTIQPTKDAADGTSGSASPSQTLQIGGSDGTDLRTLATDSSGQLKVLVENTPPVSGTVTAEIEGHAGATLDAAPGTVSPTNAIFVGGSDGTNLRAVATDTSGQVKVLVENSPSVSVSNFPATQPVSGTVTAAQATAASLQTQATLNKVTTVVTTATVAANGTFTSAWYDTNTSGALYVVVTWFQTASIPSGTNAIRINESDDNTNANFTRNVQISPNGEAAGLHRASALIKARYYQIVFTNGANAQTTGFEITNSEMDFLPSNWDGSIDSNGNVTQLENVIYTSGLSAGSGDGGSGNAANFIADATNAARALSVFPVIMTTGGATQGQRTPSSFAQASTSAAGSTALVTPGAGVKFRLMRFKIQVTADATLAVAGRLTIKLLDGSTDIGVGHIVYVPSAALNTIQDYDSGWIDLGNGYASTTAANVLNINLSSALATGVVNVVFAGMVSAVV
jgi:hypothetical protein